jgi:hypothetical protein
VIRQGRARGEKEQRRVWTRDPRRRSAHLRFGRRHKTKPGLILHADGQQGVRRCRVRRPRLSASVGTAWGAATSVNLFTEFEFCPRQGPGRHEGSPTPAGENPRPPVPSATPGGLGLAIRRAVATLGLAGWRSCERAAGTGTQKAAACARRAIRVTRNPLLSTIFLAPALAVSHFGTETRQSRRSWRGFPRQSGARRCSTFGHGPGLRRQERRAAVGLGQA